jgi:hypothetical protein
VTVRFSVIGVTTRRFEFVMIYALPATATVQTSDILDGVNQSRTAALLPYA